MTSFYPQERSDGCLVCLELSRVGRYDTSSAYGINYRQNYTWIRPISRNFVKVQENLSIF
jgi:hypothetical protein